MERNYPGEQWKSIVFDFDFVNETRVEISNFGRLRTFNKVSDGNLIKGSMINGYKIIRLKFFKAREDRIQSQLNYLKKQVLFLIQKKGQLQVALSHLNRNDAAYLTDKSLLDQTLLLLSTLKKNISKKSNDDLKSRTIYYQALFHRLVAEYFIKQPSDKHTIVAHLDYNKLNNKRINLKWMTPEENYLHQRFCPNVIAGKTYLNGRRKEDARSTKLSVTKVMLLKKLLNEHKSMRQLAKQFKVTETQILRIKRGENWGEIQAAP